MCIRDRAFGLVGFYLMLQAWMQILDMGLTPVLSREMSRFCAGTLSAWEAAIRLRTLEVLQGTLAVTTIGLFWAGSTWIGKTWFPVTKFSGETLAHAITLI